MIQKTYVGLAVLVASFLMAGAFFLSSPELLHAQDQIVPVSCGGADCGFCDLATLIQNLLNFGIFAAIFFAAIMFAYAGIVYLTNNGDSGRVSMAHKIFWNVFIGLIIILAAWIVIDTLLKTLVGGGGDIFPWNSVCGSRLTL